MTTADPAPPEPAPRSASRTRRTLGAAWRWSRRALYAAAALVVLVLVLLAGAQTYVNTEGGRRQLTALVSGVLGQDVTLSGLELHLLSGLTLKDVRLTPRGALAEHPFLVANEVTLGYSLTELVNGRLRIDQLTMNGATFELVFRGGTSNIPLAAGAVPEATAPTPAAPAGPVRTPPLPVVVVVPSAPAPSAPAPNEPVPGAPPPTHPAPSTAPPAAPVAPGIVIPPLPVTVALDALHLADVTMIVDLDGATRIESRGLDLSLHGHAGAHGTDLALEAAHRPGPGHELRITRTGRRTIESPSRLDLRLAVRGDDLDDLKFDLALKLPDASVDLGTGSHPVTLALTSRGRLWLSQASAELDPLTIDLGAGGSIELRGKIENFLAAPRIDATIQNSRLVLGELLPIVAGLVPDLSASGTVEIETLTAKGDMGGGTERTPLEGAGRIVLRDLGARYGPMGIEAADLDGTIDITRVTLVHHLPTELAVHGALTLARATLPDGGAVNGVEVVLDSSSKFSDFRDVHATVGLRAASIVAPGLGAGAKPLSLSADLTTAADLSTGDLTGIEARVLVPEALDLHASGSLGGFGKGAVKLSANVAVRPGPLLAVVPPSLLGGLPTPKASGAMKLDVDASGDLGRGDIAANGELVLDALAASNLPSGAALGGASGALTFDVKLTDGFHPGPSKVDGKLAFERLDALDAAHVQSATLELSAAASGLPLDDASAKLDLTVKGAHYRTRELETPPQDLRLTAAAHGNPTLGHLTLDGFDLAVNRVAHLTAKATIRDFGKETLEAQARLDGLELSTLALRLPRSIGSAVSGVSATGAPTFDVALAGRLPRPEELEALTVPLSGHVTFELPKGSLAWPARQLAVARGSAKLGLTFDPANFSLALDAAAFGLVDKPHLGGASRDVTATVRAALADRDRLTVSQAYLGVLNEGAFAFVGGELAGLHAALDRRTLPPLGELLRTVAGQLEVDAGFSRPAVSEVAPGFTIKGGSSNRLTVKLRPGRDVVIDGQASFSDLDLHNLPALDVTGLTGRFPIQKTLRIVTSAKTPGPAARTTSSADDESITERNRSLYGSLRPLSANRDNLRLSNLLAGPLAAHDVYLDVAFADRALRVQRFGIGVLGGWVGGSAETSFSPARNRLLFQTEFGEIDLRRLLPLESQLGDDEAQVSGTARIALDLARGEHTGKVSLGDINAELNLTRIGEETLDQLLAFLDPKGDQSSISTFRTILDTTDLTISRVQIPIQNGSLTVRVDYGLHAHVPRFLERALNIVYDTTNHFEIPSIPLLRLQNVEKLKPLFDKLEGLEPILDIVGGNQIRIEPDGSFRIE